jgi:type IV pilus assembly protein PilC
VRIDIQKFSAPQKRVITKKEIKGLSSLLNRNFSFFGEVINDSTKGSFYHELGALLQAGIDIKTAIELFEDSVKKGETKKILIQIKDSVVQGNALSTALKETGHFTPYEFFSLQIGEESGKLAEGLCLLADYFKKKVTQRRQIVQALTYPAIICVTALLAVLFMMKFVVPMFADIFLRFGGRLPYLTNVVLQISKIPFASIFILIVAMIATGMWAKKRYEAQARKMSSRLLLKIPFVGELVRKIYLARFSYAMALLIEAKLPLLRSVSLVKQMIEFYPIEEALTRAEKDIIRGLYLHQSLKDFKVFPKKMISMIRIAEEISQLHSFFAKMANQFSEEVEHQTKLIGSTVEPLIIIFLGAIIGVILVAMYLPMFQMGNLF